jgi:hypothetical protein
MTKTFCDRCEKEIKKPRFYIFCYDEKIFYKVYENWERKVICQPCFTALEKFLNNK